MRLAGERRRPPHRSGLLRAHQCDGGSFHLGLKLLPQPTCAAPGLRGAVSTWQVRPANRRPVTGVACESCYAAESLFCTLVLGPARIGSSPVIDFRP